MQGARREAPRGEMRVELGKAEAEDGLFAREALEPRQSTAQIIDDLGSAAVRLIALGLVAFSLGLLGPAIQDGKWVHDATSPVARLYEQNENISSAAIPADPAPIYGRVATALRQ
jgi:hypothetical protein